MAGSGIPYAVETALGSIVEKLDFCGFGKPPVWLLGGSCGLLLHGVQLNTLPRDIDLYCDLEDTLRLHQALLRYTVSSPEEDFSGSCFSMRGLYFIGEVKVELVGGFRIGAGSLQYAVDVGTLQQHAPTSHYEGIGRLSLMPVVHELIFNLLRGREDRCLAIAELIKGDVAAHLPLLHQLIEENHLEPEVQSRLDGLLGISESLQI
ncbi:hypothetical protein HQN87_05755 [Paenibacillus tritici]|jgi:hypothetical protein|uniref:Nucleotidyl transferase AbiEii/AbiGii toxin family protein n=1 Tax=Paenibacillus tritici TaxID=1873425 RepID=A0ABX2DK37_9BACL|nr:hypothetical protein [Paenibacillus tritici]NQX44825.1 hypothetical protein [Paenibacillus tritici]QUL52891.1 hypothetical protein KDC22_20965 [Paenibacillus tritici]